MTGQTTNQPRNNGVQVPTPRREQVTDANVGVKRGDFADGEATVLVLDFFQHLWEKYSQRVPQECNLLFVRDTTVAEVAMRENPGINVVIAQGLSRKVMNPELDEMMLHGLLRLSAWIQEQFDAGEPVNDWFDSHEHTLAFLKHLQQQGFNGLVQVVSRTLKSYQLAGMTALKNLRVQYMNKQNFFSGVFTGKVNELWERIARYENYERETGRNLLDSSVSAGRHFTRLLKQAVSPHPAEDRLFDDWARELRKYGASYETPRVMAVEMALTELERLKLTIKSGNPRAIYEHASQLPEDRRTCECLEPLPGDSSEYCWVRHFHSLHDEFNRAVWEILDMAGLMPWMQLQLELDMAGQNQRNPKFGCRVRRDYGERLRQFFHPEGPTEQWVGLLLAQRRA